MNDRKLNRRLTDMSDTASDAHEMLRGILDAVAVLERSTRKAAVDDVDDLSETDREAWRQQAEEVADESGSLLREAASLLKQAAGDIETASAETEVRAPEEENGTTSP
jgi:hypothetical protein